MKLESLRLKNFTAFGDTSFRFAAGLNAFVGENGAGKTHVLKAIYSALQPVSRPRRDGGGLPTKERLEFLIAEKLQAVFRPDHLGRLSRRAQPGSEPAEVHCLLASGQRLEFRFDASSTDRVRIDDAAMSSIDATPVYLPTRELLTLCPEFISLYESTQVRFEETWRDTCVVLGQPPAKGPAEKSARKLLQPLEEILGGKIESDDTGRFYLRAEGDRLEIHLVAEGLRKVAMLARLIAAGVLTDRGMLLWDEPEANLNPKLMKGLARAVFHLCRAGVQVFLATHSLFLLRELEILGADEEFAQVERQFTGLHFGKQGVEARQGASVDEIGDVAALDEELQQSSRYLDANARP